MSDEKRAFYEFHSCLIEPWDGPASITFTDGEIIGGVLDRNGLRPSRYCVTNDGLVVMEDAQYVEVADVDSGQPVPDGTPGDMLVTCLYKDDIYPIIRFNTHDVTQVLSSPTPLGWSFKRIAGFLGRSDNMVKIRGINIFPHALAPILEERADFAGEFLCTAVRDAAGRDELIVALETRGSVDAEAALPYRELLKRKLGVDVQVELVAPQALAALTGIETRQKPIRLIDKRFDVKTP